MVIVTLSVQEHSKWTKETSLTNKGKNQNGCESIWKKRKGKKHKKLLNIKNTNLIKACLEFFSRSLLPSGKINAKVQKVLYIMVLVYKSSLISHSSLLQAPPSHTKQFPESVLFPHTFPHCSFKIQLRRQCLFWLQSAGQVLLCIPKAPWASQHHSLFHTVYLAEIVIDCLLIFCLLSIFFLPLWAPFQEGWNLFIPAFHVPYIVTSTQ